MADGFEEEIQTLYFFLVLRTQHPVTRGSHSSRFLRTQHFSPILPVRNSVNLGTTSHLAECAQQMLAAVHFTRINQPDGLIIEHGQLYYQR